MKQNTVIHILLGVAVLLGIALLSLVLGLRSQMRLSLWEWILLGGVALAMVLAAFLPSVIGRFRGLPPPQPLSRSDIGSCIMVVLVGCALAVVGGFSGMWWLGTLAITLPPLWFMFRGARQRQSDQKS
jgi:hypothetical protein